MGDKGSEPLSLKTTLFQLKELLFSKTRIPIPNKRFWIVVHLYIFIKDNCCYRSKLLSFSRPILNKRTILIYMRTTETRLWIKIVISFVDFNIHVHSSFVNLNQWIN